MSNFKRYTSAALAVVIAGTASTVLPSAFAAETQAKQAVAGTELVNLQTEWKYLDDNTDPAGTGERTSWTTVDFDDSAWKTSAGFEAKFGAKNGAIKDLGNNSTPAVLLNQYIEGTTTDIPAFFFRTGFELDGTPEDLELTGSLKYDDAVIVYVNGTKIAAFDEPTDGFETNLSYGGSNASDPIDATFTVDASCLTEGANTVAVELHQGRTSSSDMYFEMSSLVLTEKEESDTDPDSTDVEQKSISLTVGTDETQRNITWYANTAEAGKVQYGEKNGDEFPTAYSEATAEATETNDTGFYSNQATLVDLKANTEYVYRLVNGATVSQSYSFRTGDTKSFSFILAGDPQIGAGKEVSDTQGWENTLNTAIENFPSTDFLISAGDQVNTANNESQYAGYLEHSVLTSLTTATVIGNHDSSSSAYSEHFNNPNTTSTGGKSYGLTTAGGDYWYTYDNTLFLNINSNNTSIAEHKAFMEDAIAANPDVEWKVVVFHHSIYSVASHALEDSIISRRNDLVPVFTELDIDVVLMGHDHVYVRSYMMDGFTPDTANGVQSTVTNPTGILYITANSASGSKYYNIQNVEFDYAAVKSQEKTPSFSNVEVTDDTFTITTYRTNDMSVIDTFEIKHEDVPATEPDTEPDTEPITPSVIIGDVNLDGTVTIEDATLLQKYIADIEVLDSDSLVCAECNGDGEITISDATAIQKYIAGILTQLG